MSGPHTIGVVGNPNCGKTTLFNALTGSRQRVGNWPGVTVERKTGRYRYRDHEYEIVDLPGTYSLDVVSDDISLDEKIARDFVHAGDAGVIVNIVDASNLERNLYLTVQLIEMRQPLVVVLNMTDVAAAHGVAIDVPALSQRLGCPVVPVVASEGAGIDELKRTLARAVNEPPIPTTTIPCDGALEQAIAGLLPGLTGAPVAGTDPRWLASRLLEGDDLARRVAGDSVPEQRLEALRAGLGDDVDIMLADARYGFANRVVNDTVQRRSQASRSLTDRIDQVVLNRALGIPIFLAVMYLMFMFTINIGGAFIDFFGLLAGALVVEGLGMLLDHLGSPQWLTVLLADGIGGGIQVVATFIPVIAFLYLFLSVLEDSGYMARAAFVMDRGMRAVGLPGKSFVPLIVGFGCNVPAIMATRTLENQRERILTIIMAPFMSCGARLPVYALFAAAFFPADGQIVVFALYLIGIAVAVLTGLIMKNTLLRGESTPFIMELPPYHRPRLGAVATRTRDRTSSFVFRAGRVIVPMVLVLNVLNTVGTDGSFGHQNTGRSVLSEVGRGIAPAFSPMGLDEENWPAAVGIFTGILAKEAVVGTLDSMYSSLAEVEDKAASEERAYNIRERFIGAFASVPAALSEAIAAWSDPLGMGVGDIVSIETAAESQEVAAGTYGAMAARFDGAAGAFAYLLFILLYSPCTAALAAVYRESNLGWTLFVAGWSTAMAYAAASMVYQTSLLGRDPAAVVWITGIAGGLLVMVLAMRWWGTHRVPRPLKPAAVRV